ncbi:hypothetical protein [Syntrophorhabdus aromaticivorans]|jgi:hypothetical protein|uniref:hypothetical protein n=1 Tax=Syntrophorhabdus aromaticivorans TaxID=328301 RepID=UPI000429C612|nr:hypothetical protein [Syntrophorhabdus aromaticivorans]
MSIAIVDARGWQNTLDLKTGEKIDAAGPVIEMVKDVLQRHPYPGDIDPGSNRWVSDAAFDLIDRYNPRFVFLTYAAQYFSGRYTPMSKETRARMISDVFLEAERFINRSGFAAIAAGTGDMTPLLGFIDITRLDGLAVCTHWSTRHAGLYGPSPEDMKLLGQHPHIEKIIPQEEVLSLFDGTSEQAFRLPEYLMLACEGYAFKTISDAMRMPVMIPSLNFNVPLYAPGHAVEAITGIRQVLEKDLSEKNVAFIAMEGIGLDEFLWPHLPCRNGVEWCYYEPGEAQYLTIVSGRHRFLDYPTGSGYKYFNGSEGATRGYPFSGHFKSIPEGAFASTFPGRSIAVGNKSMFMHMVTGADLSVECFARNLYNQGTMAVIHRQDKL